MYIMIDLSNLDLKNSKNNDEKICATAKLTKANGTNHLIKNVKIIYIR